MKHFIKLAASGLGLALSGCASAPLTINAVPNNFQIAQPPSPEPLNLSSIHFTVVTKDTMQSFIDAQVKAQNNQNPVFIVLDSNGYKAIRINIAELQRYIIQQQKIIVYYKTVTSAVSHSR